MNKGGPKEVGPKTAGAAPSLSAGEEEESGFLGRWSRRKAASRELPAVSQAPDETKSQKIEADEALVDPATLPPIDSLTAESDFTVFLRKGVPESLRNAALQKLWRTEPSVVNYIPLVEYNWDFNAPGYGALRPTDDVVKLARAAWGQVSEPSPNQEVSEEKALASAGTEPPSLALDPARSTGPETSAEPADSAPKTGSDPPSAGTKSRPARRHGGALPT